MNADKNIKVEPSNLVSGDNFQWWKSGEYGLCLNFSIISEMSDIALNRPSCLDNVLNTSTLKWLKLHSNCPPLTMVGEISEY